METSIYFCLTMAVGKWLSENGRGSGYMQLTKMISDGLRTRHNHLKYYSG